MDDLDNITIQAHSKIDKINLVDYRKEPIVVTIPTKKTKDDKSKSPVLQPKHRTLSHTGIKSAKIDIEVLY